MAVLTIIKEIKKIHPKEIVMVKIGDFFHVYGKDSYILAYLLGYKLKMVEDNVSGQQKDVLKPSKMRCKIKTSKF